MPSYLARTGVPVTIYHPVRDIAGAYVAGQAAAVTKALLDPDRVAAPAELATAVLTDIAAGWVRARITLSGAGIYTLTLTNPAQPTADGLATDYDLVVGPGIDQSTLLLTSLDRVRQRFMPRVGTDNHVVTPGEPHEFDDLITTLISEVSDEYQEDAGRTFAEQPYVEYLDGNGRGSLVLGAGPLVSVEGLWSVDYQDDGAGGVTEVLTVVPRSTYVLCGLRTQPRYTGRGRIDLIGSDWGAMFTCGQRNYKVAYTAGWDVLPEKLVGAATADVVSRLMTRDTGHLLTQSLGDTSVAFLRPGQMAETREAALASYRLEAI